MMISDRGYWAITGSNLKISVFSFHPSRTLIESDPSAEVEVSYMDITAPGAPQGLVAIPTKEGVLLKWVPKTEQDFAGFHLYRKEPDEDRFIRINKKLITKNSMVDATAQITKRYVYGVTAVDFSQKGNESDLSETVEILYLVE